MDGEGGKEKGEGRGKGEEREKGERGEKEGEKGYVF